MSISNIDTRSTRGAYNSSGYIAHRIRFDEDKMMCYSAGFAKDDIEAPIFGGIIVLSNADDSICPHQFKACIDKVESITRKNNISRWSLGRYMHTKYMTNEGIVFNENSVSVEIQDVTT